MSGKVDWKMLDEAVCQVFKVGASRLLFREPPFCAASLCLGPYWGLGELLSATRPLTDPSLSS